MSLKSALNAALFLGLVLPMSGCCTMNLSESAHKIRSDRFTLSAIYQETNGDGVALQGILFISKEPPAGGLDTRQSDSPDVKRGAEALVGSAGRRPQSPEECSYLVIPQELVTPGLSPTNPGPWLHQLHSRWSGMAEKATLQNNPPGGYEKAADLPDRAETLTLARRPYKGWMALAPVTVAVDVATSPLQILWITFLLLSGAHM